MKNFIFLLLMGLILFSASGFGSDSGKILPYPIHQNRLANGLNVVTVPFDSPGLAAFYIVVRVGSRNEVEKGVTGFAHFFEHMMFRGTDKYSKEKYNEVLKSIGASANANTSLDRTIYHMTGNAEKLELMFEIESDRFQNLNYSEHGFKTEAGAVKGEYTKNIASPYTKLYEMMVNTAFDVHTYKHTTMGFFDDILDMPNQYDYSLDFFKRYYRPEYSTVVVVGDVTPEKVNSLAEKFFGKWEKGNYQSDLNLFFDRDRFGALPMIIEKTFESGEIYIMNAISVENLSKFYNNYEALKKISFEVKKGDNIRVLWANELVDAQGNFLLHVVPVDTSLHWAYSLHGYTQYTLQNAGIPIGPGFPAPPSSCNIPPSCGVIYASI